MKSKLAACLLLIATAAFASKLAVKTSPGDSRTPAGWPTFVMELNHAAPIPSGMTEMTTDQINALKASLKPQMDSILAAERAADDAKVSNRRKIISDLFDDFQTYEQGWKDGTNYNAAQLQVIIRKHNASLLLLKPMLKDLYESRND
jgi:hypothetical protein